MFCVYCVGTVWIGARPEEPSLIDMEKRYSVAVSAIACAILAGSFGYTVSASVEIAVTIYRLVCVESNTAEGTKIRSPIEKYCPVPVATLIVTVAPAEPPTVTAPAAVVVRGILRPTKKLNFDPVAFSWG